MPSQSELDALAFAFGDEQQLEIGSIDEPPPPAGEPVGEYAYWQPDLNPTQQLIFNDPADNVLAYGEKGSGKTVAVGHKAVRHAYENMDALVVIIMATQRAGSLGILGDIDRFVLPAWKEGMGLQFTDSKLDANTKDRYRWIRNRHGGWSMIMLMSVLYAKQMEQRIKGPTPSMVVVDELTECEGVEYWTFPALQLGRRAGVEGPQQYVACCNPKGPSNWVYKLWWDDNSDNPRFSKHHVPFMENAHRVPPDYLARIKDICKKDPTEEDRLIKGLWVDRPTGDGLFKEFFVATLHLKGDSRRGIGLLPRAGFPMILGYDLGQVYSSIRFEQSIYTTSGNTVWVVFDEIDYLGQKILYKNLAKEVVDKLAWWSKKIGYQFPAIHVTDDSAINQWRPGGEGSYDAWEFEREYSKVTGRPIRMKGCPKGAGSVPARVRMMQAKLAGHEFFVSAMCKNTENMLLQLEADPNDPERPKRGKWIHPFDSTTYPIFFMEMRYTKNSLQTGQAAPSIIRCGTS